MAITYIPFIASDEMELVKGAYRGHIQNCCCLDSDAQIRLVIFVCDTLFNRLRNTDHVMHQQFNIQQLYVLPALCWCVLYLSGNKPRLVPLTSQTGWFYNRDGKCLLRGTNWIFK
jgi:hypothetical protein